MTDKPLILLIDDELKILQALKRVLGNEGYEVLCASVPEDGLDLLQKNPVDVIICDQNMPGMKGSEVLKRASQMTPDTVRILLTGYSDVNTAISAINDGRIFHYFSKPWDNGELLRIVEKGVLYKREEERKRNISSEVYSQLTGLLTNMNSAREARQRPGEARLEPAEEQKKLRRLPVVSEGKTILLNSSDVYYLMAENGKVFAVTPEGRYKCDGSLELFEKKLEADHFLRCHKSYLVNLDKISEISPWFNGALNLKFKEISDTISVSRNYAARLKQQFEL
jgi:DNA-binding LytR/AlgR family response regulator